MGLRTGQDKMDGRQLADAQRYREHAAEVRQMAQRLTPENRDTMLGIAQQYEAMAHSLEGIEETMQSMRQLLDLLP